MKNKWIKISTFNLLLWLAYQFQYELNLDMILDPEGPSRIALVIALYLFLVAPVVTLGILILFIYKLLKNQLENDHIIAALISSIYLLISILSLL